MAKEPAETKKSSNPKILLFSIIGIVIIIAIVAVVSTMNLATPPENNGGITDNEVVIGEITTFRDTGDTIELQDGKPVIRLFSTTWCSHCTWVKETYDKVVNEYVAAGKIVAYHWELDIRDDALTPQNEGSVPGTELAVNSKFNPQGYVPHYVFGGKYVRIGNGYETQDDLVAEEAEFRGVIEALLEEANQQ